MASEAVRRTCSAQTIRDPYPVERHVRSNSYSSTSSSKHQSLESLVGLVVEDFDPVPEAVHFATTLQKRHFQIGEHPKEKLPEGFFSDVVIGPLEDLEVLGRGGEATVYECEIKGKEFAVKVYRELKDPKYKDIQRQQRELAILSKISHPNIISIHGMQKACFIGKRGRFEEIQVLVMEYIPGSLELFDHIVSEKKPHLKVSDIGISDEERAKRLKNFEEVARGIILGLKAIHDKGCIYRDLKPSNILMTRDPSQEIGVKPVLIDFGFSRDQRTASGMPLEEGEPEKEDDVLSVCGTEDYVSPELLESANEREEGSIYDGVKNDMFSLGALLYVMATSSPATAKSIKPGITSGEEMVAIKQMPLKFGKTPEILRDLIVSLMNPDPEKRLTMDQVMVHPFFALSE